MAAERVFQVDVAEATAAVKHLLFALGVSTTDGNRDTPARVARFWREFLDGEPGPLDTVFEDRGMDQLIVVGGVRVWSMCEHHLLPFSCDLTMGYLASGKVLGLSKFARIAHVCARRLQMQERLTREIADALAQRVGEDVAVVARGEHLCATMRGVRTASLMTTSEMRGRFRAEQPLRSEFMGLLSRRREDFA